MCDWVIFRWLYPAEFPIRNDGDKREPSKPMVLSREDHVRGAHMEGETRLSEPTRTSTGVLVGHQPDTCLNQCWQKGDKQADQCWHHPPKGVGEVVDDGLLSLVL